MNGRSEDYDIVVGAEYAGRRRQSWECAACATPDVLPGVCLFQDSCAGPNLSGGQP
jgi:hypothetical protein